MSVVKNDHMAFQVSNMDRSIQFYTESLGLRLLFRATNEEEKEDSAFLELDGGNLELIQSLGGSPFEKPRIQPPYCPHLALRTDDMAETVKMIRARHIPIVRGPLSAKEATWIYISDPDNNIVEYIQWL